MKFSEFCRKVKKLCPRLKSQIAFLDALAAVSGHTLCISDSYKKKLFSGDPDVRFTDNVKGDFSGASIEELTAFFERYIHNSKLGDAITSFGIPESDTPDHHALCVALAYQFQAILDSTEEDAEDVIISEYQKAKAKTADTPVPLSMKPRYPGDDIYVHFQTHYEIKSTATFVHIWNIQNRGTQTWKNRKLVYIRDPKIDRPEAVPAEIAIDDVEPNEYKKITTTFDGRGFDGVFHCVWEMQDEHGENCFPGRTLLFCVTIDSKYKRP